MDPATEVVKRKRPFLSPEAAEAYRLELIVRGATEEDARWIAGMAAGTLPRDRIDETTEFPPFE